MRFLLLALAAACLVTPFAHSQPIDLFTLYQSDGVPFDAQPGYVPPEPAFIYTFSLPATPTGPLPYFYVDGTKIIEGFTINNVPVVYDQITYDGGSGTPLTHTVTSFLADITFSGLYGDLFAIEAIGQPQLSFESKGGYYFTTSADDVPTFSLTTGGYPDVLFAFQAYPLGVLSIDAGPESNPVPEPSSLLLLGTGGLALAVRAFASPRLRGRARPLRCWFE